MTDYEKLLEDADTVGDSLEAMQLARRLAAALREVMAENACDACGGTGKPVSGLTCMCGGTGKMSVAAPVLRLAAVQANARAEAALAIIGKIRCVVGKAGTDDDVLDAVRSALADVEAMRAVVSAGREIAEYEDCGQKYCGFCDHPLPDCSGVCCPGSRLRAALRALDARATPPAVQSKTQPKESR